MVHSNVHVPKESFPFFLFLVIEFAIVTAVSVGVSSQVTPTFQEIVVGQGLICTQKSHITNCQMADEISIDEGGLTWIFWGIVGVFFLVWYLGLRSIVFRKVKLK